MFLWLLIVLGVFRLLVRIYDFVVWDVLFFEVLIGVFY